VFVQAPTGARLGAKVLGGWCLTRHLRTRVPKTSGCGGQSFFSGDYRLGPAPSGDLRPILVRDLRGMQKKPTIDMSNT
jgi:hypothetical protein